MLLLVLQADTRMTGREAAILATVAAGAFLVGVGVVLYGWRS